MRTSFLILFVLSFSSYSEEITFEEIGFGGLSEGMALACFGMYQSNNDFDELALFSKIRATVRVTRSGLNGTQKELWVEYRNKALKSFNEMRLAKKIVVCEDLKKHYPSSERSS